MEGKKQFMAHGGYQGPGKKKIGRWEPNTWINLQGVCAHRVKTFLSHRSACLGTFTTEEALRNQTGKTPCLMDVNRPLSLVALVAVQWTLAVW